MGKILKISIYLIQLLIISNFFFCHSVFKIRLQQRHKQYMVSLTLSAPNCLKQTRPCSKSGIFISHVIKDYFGNKRQTMLISGETALYELTHLNQYCLILVIKSKQCWFQVRQLVTSWLTWISIVCKKTHYCLWLWKS